MTEDQDEKEELESTGAGKALVHVFLDQARDNCDEGHCNSFADSLIS